jgi:hypothetical protein
MRIGAVIFSYNRPDMLLEALKPLGGWVSDYVILDDCSPYKMMGKNVIQNKVREGKKGFWKQMDKAFKWAKESNCDWFVFMPDDFLNLNTERIECLMNNVKEPFAFNLIFDGRVNQWIPFEPTKVFEIDAIEVGYCDGGFFCSRNTLELLSFEMLPVEDSWFNRPNKSSGIGRQLTERMRAKNVKLYCPVKSLAYHGTHESMMNPEERKLNPLISQ